MDGGGGGEDSAGQQFEAMVQTRCGGRMREREKSRRDIDCRCLNVYSSMFSQIVVEDGIQT